MIGGSNFKLLWINSNLSRFYKVSLQYAITNQRVVTRQKLPYGKYKRMTTNRQKSQRISV